MCLALYVSLGWQLHKYNISKLVDLQGWIAQLVRASGICPEGPGFNPWSGHFSVL